MPKNAGAKTEDAAPKAALPEGEKAYDLKNGVEQRSCRTELFAPGFGRVVGENPVREQVTGAADIYGLWY